MKNLIVFFNILFTSSFYCQKPPQIYFDLIKKADSLYYAKDYKSSALFFSSAFKENGGKAYEKDRYSAACSWALANYPDSAFFHLNRIVIQGKYKDLITLTSDKNFVTLHPDQRWTVLIETVKQNKEKAEAKLNKPLVKILDSIYFEDQHYRLQVDVIEKKFGNNSKQMDSIWHIIREKDSSNVIVITKVLDQYGWLGPDVIGGRGGSTLFLVIQHSDQKTREKYLPMMREAVKNRKAASRDLALLEDRVALGQNKKQIYGSQIGRDDETGIMYVLPLEDPDNVDKRRAEVYLPPIAEYISNWQLKWDVEQFKKEQLLRELNKK
ncbi:MAG: hypothetical protein Q7W45_04050 [Bacteroidota bacterium]|nr:hypothetical protein [Bacteroidota bacterium]MDP3144619.1 hypothetical protein [Bacteroidota bacterium]MDP3556558.1 hypothetical protein [Bacteroidota bacterium]